MIGNVPDDWNMYYGKCAECGETFHRSGTVTCACTECRLCECLFPPTHIQGDVCNPCVESCAWAWIDTELEEHLLAMTNVVDDGAGCGDGETEILHKIELLKSSLEAVHRRLTEGFTAI